MKYSLIGGLLVSFLAFSCSKSSSSDPTGPVNPPDTTVPGGHARNVIAWVDARSNVFGTYGKLNDTTQAKGVLDKLKEVGVTALVIDLRSSTGYTMYPSALTKELRTLDGKSLPDGVDYAAFMIREAKKRSLKVYTSIVTFVEGEPETQTGTVFDDPDFRSKYESVVCDPSGQRVSITSRGRSAFLNPAAPEVQERELSFIREIVGKYDIDGFILDYARYSDIDADFSDLSKTQFISFLKNKLGDTRADFIDFPKDIVTNWQASGSYSVPATTGKYFNKWLYYRASVIHDFFVKARQAVKAIKPNAQFGVYVGAWYSSYYSVGVNWASEDYDPFGDQQIRFDWAYPGYQTTGYTEQLDILMTGNYFTQIRLSENPATANLKYHWWSIEGSINGTQYITRNKVPLYGSIDLGNTDWANTSRISAAIKYILDNTSGGVMLFDVVHMYAPQYNRLNQQLWDAVKAGTAK